MRVKLLKNIRKQDAPTIQILAGAIVDIPDDITKAWVSNGVAESLRQTTIETAILPQCETAVSR